MTTTILRANVVSDDVLHVADEGKTFKGGFAAIIEYFTYATPWSDKRHIKRFKSVENAEKYIKRHYA